MDTLFLWDSRGEPALAALYMRFRIPDSEITIGAREKILQRDY
jgi:hypothetical protein